MFPQGAAGPTGPGQYPAGTNPAAAGAVPTMDPSQLRQANMYDPTDPQTALLNMLHQMNLSPYNPLIARSVLPAAQGLGSAFSLQQAMNPGVNGSSMPSMDFQSFLQNVLSGRGSQGLFGTLQNAAQQIQGGGLEQLLQQAGMRQSAGQPITNPYLSDMMTMRTNPQAILSMLQSLQEPVLGQQLARSGRTMGELQAANAWRTMPIGTEANPYDFFQALFGGGGQPRPGG